MLIYINYACLDKGLKKAIYSKTISVEDLKKVYASLKAESNRKKKVLNIVIPIIFVVSFLLFIPSIAMEGHLDIIIPAILITALFLAIIYGIVYLLQIGIIKIQFNKAIKNNYPNLEKELKL